MVEIYELCYLFIATLDTRFQRGEYMRDCQGRVIWSLDELLIAIELGQWP